MRLPVSLAAFALVSCKPATPAEPVAPPPEPAAPPAATEPVPKDTLPVATAPASEPERCVCPDPAAAAEEAADEAVDDVSDEEDPVGKSRKARARKKIARTLVARLKQELPDHRAACDVALSGPCTLKGDFDGDGARDEVVLVRDAKGAGGLAFVWAKGGSELVGGGRRGLCWIATEVPDVGAAPEPDPCPEEVDVDLSWLEHWDVRPREVGPDGPVLVGKVMKRVMRFAAAGAVGDGVLLDGGDAAAVLYRRADAWVLMHLGY